MTKLLRALACVGLLSAVALLLGQAAQTRPELPPGHPATTPQMPPGHPAIGPQAPTATSRPAAVEADPADVASIDAILTAYYESISGAPGASRNWERFRSLFMPQARFVTVRTTGEKRLPYVMSVEDYERANATYFEQGGYYEAELHRRTEEFGGIAHVLSTYASRRGREDAAPYSRGVNSIQLLHDGTRWWIVSVMWDHEREGRSLPPEYLPPG